MSATTYFANMTLNAALRGQAFTVPTQLWLALHTADPTEDGDVAEVDTADWPAYARADLLAGGAIADAFTTSVAAATSNAHQMLWPAMDGVSNVEITHWSICDAPTGGNALVYGEMVQDPNDPESAADHKILSTNDEFVIPAGRLAVFQL